MPLHLTLSRQRVPMLDASTLEDRTRPVLDGLVAARLRYFTWSHWHSESERLSYYGSMTTAARLGRR